MRNINLLYELTTDRPLAFSALLQLLPNRFIYYRSWTGHVIDHIYKVKTFKCLLSISVFLGVYETKDSYIKSLRIDLNANGSVLELVHSYINMPKLYFIYWQGGWSMRPTRDC